MCALEKLLNWKALGNGLIQIHEGRAEIGAPPYPPALVFRMLFLSRLYGGTLKRELVYHCDYLTRDEARVSIFEYVETLYNRRWRHSPLDHLVPEATEQLLACMKAAYSPTHRIGGRSKFVASRSA